MIDREQKPRIGLVEDLVAAFRPIGLGNDGKNFVHETDEVVIVVEGEMEFAIEGQVYHPQIGEELFIPAGARHSARNVGKKTAQWLYGYAKGK